MSGEWRVARGALVPGVLGTIVGAGALYAFRGSDGAVSVLLASGIVLANAGVSALVSSLAGRLSSTGSMMIALPSFALRMSLIGAALTMLKGRAFVDDAVFAISFAVAIFAVIALEMRTWKRTPWIALAFETEDS